MGDGPDLFIDAHERLGDYRARALVAPAGDALDERRACSWRRPLAAVTRAGAAPRRCRSRRSAWRST